MSEKIGRRNQETVAGNYRKEGYQVLDVNRKGFPDLIVLKNREIRFFVEVKGGRHKVHPFQEETHKELEKLGFQVKIVRLGSKVR